MLQDLVYRFLVGGACVALVGLLAQKGMPEYAGIVMTFPVITAVSLVMSDGNVNEIAKAGLLGLVSTAGFIVTCMLLLKYGKYVAVTAGVFVWAIVSTVLLMFLSKNFLP